MRSPRPDGGSVLMLMPAAVVIVLLLGAIAVDAAIVHLEQRQAYNVAFDAANDAAGAGIDRDELRATGALVFDPVRVREVAAESVAAAGAHDVTLVDVSVDPDGGVSVTVRVHVRRLFGQAFGGRSSQDLELTAHVDGELRRGGPPRDGSFDP